MSPTRFVVRSVTIRKSNDRPVQSTDTSGSAMDFKAEVNLPRVAALLREYVEKTERENMQARTRLEVENVELRKKVEKFRKIAAALKDDE